MYVCVYQLHRLHEVTVRCMSCMCDVHGCVCRWLQEGLTSSLTTRTPWRFAVLGRWYGLLLMGTPERGQTLLTNTPVPTACTSAVAHHSSAVAHHSYHHSSAVAHCSSAVAHHSSAVAHHSSAVAHCSSAVAHHSSAVAHHSSAVAHHSSAVAHHSSAVAHHSFL